MSIVALPAPMAAVSRYLWGVKACTQVGLEKMMIDLFETLFRTMIAIFEILSVTMIAISEILFRTMSFHLFELLDKQDEVFLVLGRPSPFCRVFPIKVKTCAQVMLRIIMM